MVGKNVMPIFPWLSCLDIIVSFQSDVSLYNLIYHPVSNFVLSTVCKDPEIEAVGHI